MADEDDRPGRLAGEAAACPPSDVGRVGRDGRLPPAWTPVGSTGALTPMAGISKRTGTRTTCHVRCSGQAARPSRCGGPRLDRPPSRALGRPVPA